jgi:hypothetical protein
MVKILMEYHEEIDFRAKETMNGNTVLHLACLLEDLETAERIFFVDYDLCLEPNFLGRSPFFVACQKRNLDLLHIFWSRKSQAVAV